MPKTPAARRRRDDRLTIDGRSLTIDQVCRVAYGDVRRVTLDRGAARRMERARAFLRARMREGAPVYGVNTGFGSLKDTRIPPARLAQLQRNLIRSHCCGVGDPLPIEVVRAIMLLRANTLASGHCGTRPVVARRLLDFLNRGLVPIIPAQGSVGASGDLAPLAHLAAVLMGEGEALYGEEVGPAAAGLARAKLKPLAFEPKEALSLINGTQMMTAIGALALGEAERLCAAADLTAALTLDASMGSVKAFDPRLVGLRPHPGAQVSAANVRKLVKGSAVLRSHRGCGKVQDRYSLRCVPQVHGAARDAVGFARRALEVEINAVTDNPILFPGEGEILSGGNFHGQPVALALDVLTLAVAELGAIAERRVESLVNPQLSRLPPFLTEESGLHSGFMMLQVTAAALASENKTLCHPASVDSIPTSANQEDHVSMGPIAARKAAAVVENAWKVLAIELLTACQALEFHRPLRSSRALEATLAAVRAWVPRLGEDRDLSRDLGVIAGLLEDGDLLAVPEAVVGRLR